MTMRCTRALAVATFVATLVLGIATPALEAAAASPAPPQPPDTPFVAKLLPVAAGALVGAATGFFIVPLLVPGVAVVAVAGPPTSPFFGFAGASLGAVIGTQVSQ